ncbi:kinase-like domain-containing protein [Chaetomium sp. MPI-CAGE-AT-0009]|nr:kinase-like domain-containing protein [Chaetomium sp. MPI-CAGE-AT-0009]
MDDSKDSKDSKSPMATLMADSWGPPPTSPTYEDPGLKDVESLEGYAPGGYYPMNIDDQLRNNSDTYTIIHKLGFGRCSTVWLAKRESEESESSGKARVSFHALKILRADLSTPEEYPELELVRRLRQVGRWNNHGLVYIQDWFTTSSPNGEHRCFVLPFLGPSLYDKRVLDAMSSETRDSVCEQLAEAVSHVHIAGVCHADLSPLNVRFRIPKLKRMSEQSIRGILTPIESCEIRRTDGQPLSNHCPRRVVRTGDFQDLDFASLKTVTIISFGRAFRPPSTPYRPTAIPSPELLFGYSPSQKSDIWQLACLVYLVHERDLPFLIHVGYEHLVWELTTYLGPVPDHWAGRYQWDTYKMVTPSSTTRDSDLDQWFDKSQPTESLESHLVQAERAEELATLLGKMLVWEPEKRLPAGLVYKELWEQRRRDESD